MAAVCIGRDALPVIEKKGAQILYETTATALLQDEDNRVTGLKAVDAAGDSVIIDSKSVVLACGGFEGNPEMLAKYIGSQARYMRPVARGGWYNKGEGIRMALDAGAAPAATSPTCTASRSIRAPAPRRALINAFPLGIVVNKNGERFFNEAHSEYDYYAEGALRRHQSAARRHRILHYDAKIDDVPNWRVAIRSDSRRSSRTPFRNWRASWESPSTASCRRSNPSTAPAPTAR